MTLERGAILNKRYRILEILGEGGMGAVYKAVDENLGVTVAVKENLFTTEEYTRQFQIEASILASLRHSNLPRVTDHFDIEGEGQYLVMDYIEGEDLRDRMDRLGVLSEKEVVIIGMAICDAMTYLHTRTPPVLHRDMKPGNVKITPIGHVYLVDFGLAKIVQGSQITITGARAMTPGYSPPEQYGTARTDARSDVYSLGATLYSALTGALPEDGLARAMSQTELTPIRRRNPKVSKRLAVAVEQALAVQPDERFQTAEELKNALLKSLGTTFQKVNLENLTVPPPPASVEESVEEIGYENQLPEIVDEVDETAFETALETDIFETFGKSSPRNKRIGCWIVLLILAVITVVGGTTFYLMYPELTAQVLEFIISPSITTTPSSSQPVLVESQIKATETNKPPTDIFKVTSTNSPTPTSTRSTATNTATITGSPTLTNQPTKKPTITPSSLPTATKDQNATQLPIPPTPNGGGFGQIAFASVQNGSTQIWLINSDGTNLQQFTELRGGACQPDWSHDGMFLMFISPCSGEQESYRDSRIYIIDFDKTELLPLPTVPGGDYDPSWSSDGKFVIFTSLRNDKPELFKLNLETDEVKLMTDQGLHNIQGDWNNSGNKIAFITTRQGPYQIWLMDVDGSNPFRLSPTRDLKNTHPHWSPDDKLIVFTQREVPNGVPKLVITRPEDVNTLPLDLFDDSIPRRNPQFSPDGNWLVFESWPDGENHDIYIAKLSAQFGITEVIQLTSGTSFEFDPTWRPNLP